MSNLRNDRVHESVAPVTVGASATAQAVTRPFGVTGAGASRLRLDFYIGRAAAATGITCGMQQSSGLGVWSTTKTTSITASTQKTFDGFNPEVTNTTWPAGSAATNADYLHVTATDETTFGVWLNKRVHEVQTITYPDAATADHQDFIVVEDTAGVTYAVALTKPVASVDTANFADIGSTAAGDYLVVYDAAGLAWAVAADLDGNDDEPTGAIWVSIPAGRKAQADLTGLTTDEDIAVAFEAAFAGLTGFSTAFTTDDSAADGTMLFTRDAVGPTTAPVVKNADDSGVGSIACTNTTTGVASVAPSGPIWTAATHKGLADISGDTTAAQVAARAETAWNALTGFTAAITTNDTAANGTMTLTQVVAGVTEDPVPKNAAEDGAGNITGVETTAGVTTNTEPSGVLYTASDVQIEVAIEPGYTAAQVGAAARAACAADATFAAAFTIGALSTASFTITQTTAGDVTDPAPYTENEGGAGSISVSVTTAGTDSETAPSTDSLTVTSHGYSTGDAVVASTTGTLPLGLNLNTIYYAQVTDANTLKLRTRRDDPSSVVDITGDGTGIHSLTLVRKFSITFNSEVAGDQTYLPLAPLARGYITSGASDSCQVLAVHAIQAD